MSVVTEIQLLEPSAIIELFELDATRFRGGSYERFHAGTNGLTQNIVFDGNTYSAVAMEAEGFASTTRGALPRPKLRMVNAGGEFSALIRENDDLIGCPVKRIRTFAKYLDAVNFPGGTNPLANPLQRLPDEIWFVERRTMENRYMIEWELSSALDLQGVKLPYREVIQNLCTWRYRSPECGYTGTGYFNRMDQPCAQSDDFCGKRLSSCRLRFGQNAELPYGGFPGAVRYNNA